MKKIIRGCAIVVIILGVIVYRPVGSVERVLSSFTHLEIPTNSITVKEIEYTDFPNTIIVLETTEKIENMKSDISKVNSGLKVEKIAEKYGLEIDGIETYYTPVRDFFGISKCFVDIICKKENIENGFENTLIRIHLFRPYFIF